MTVTATFTDTYFGPTAMVLKPVRTTRGGQRAISYRWEAAPGTRGCITTGLVSFRSVARALAAAQCHALFSDVCIGV